MFPASGAISPEPLRAFNGLPGLGSVRALFTTRAGGVSAGPYASLNLGLLTGDDAGNAGRNWGILRESQGLGDRDPAIPPLRHGAACVEARRGATPEDLARAAPGGADAVFTREPGVLVAVTMADCLAALVADPETGCVAAVHAGWRGARDNILGRTLARLFAEGHCRPESTRVALGPCLSAAALEIGEDVAATLPAAHVSRAGGRARFDLRGCNRAQALAAGVPAAHLEEAGGCTRDNPGLFFSHRRDAGVTGRMAACIVLA